MTSTKEALWSFFDRMIYKCQETEEKSIDYQTGHKLFEHLLYSKDISISNETDIIAYVACVQRIAYITGLTEGIKLHQFVNNHTTNQINEFILELIGDLRKETEA